MSIDMTAQEIVVMLSALYARRDTYIAIRRPDKSTIDELAVIEPLINKLEFCALKMR